VVLGAVDSDKSVNPDGPVEEDWFKPRGQEKKEREKKKEPVSCCSGPREQRVGRELT